MNTLKIKLIAIGIVAILAGGGLWLGKSLGSNSTAKNNSSKSASVKEFNSTLANFKYNPSSVDVNLGDSVVINITNTDNVTHGINLPAFGVAESVAPGTTKRIEFVADKTGSPELFCSSDHGEKLLINVSG